jgi:hypothetical protein
MMIVDFGMDGPSPTQTTNVQQDANKGEESGVVKRSDYGHLNMHNV